MLLRFGRIKKYVFHKTYMQNLLIELILKKIRDCTIHTHFEY